MSINPFESLSRNLAERLLDLRSRRGLTQADLAKMASVPRSTVANLESGTGNPSLVNLAKISSALNTSIEILLTTPMARCKKIPADQVRSISRSGGEVMIVKLLPDPIPGMEIDKIELNVGAKMRGIPHAAGTREYLHCLQGEIIIVVAGETYHISKGDVLAFPGEGHHSYENGGKTKAVGLSVVAIAPIGL
ncbi:MAG: helix-turn-helix transcriptional regulator [Bacteriovorax sp.]|nr:helix-turn-helix transcriptional regulator [Bacteriovorax sp.]